MVDNVKAYKGGLFMKYKWNFKGDVKVKVTVKGYGKLKFAMTDSNGETEADLRDIVEIYKDFVEKCFNTGYQEGKEL